VSSAAPAKPVVIYRLGSLGDTVVALPCFHAIARHAPDAERVVLTNFPVSAKAAPLEAILSGSGLIHRALAYPVGTRSVRALWALRKQLKALGADTLYYLTPARGMLAVWRDVIYFRLCGFKHIIGAPIKSDVQRSRIVNSEGHIEQECVRLARCFADIGPINLDDSAMWDMRLSQAERSAAKALVAPLQSSPFLAINMGGKLAMNDWGEPHWLVLLSQLSARYPGLGLLVVGGPEDSARAQKMAAIWQGRLVDACGRLKPRESAAAMQGASLFVGHDSGPLHLAAAVGVPCIGLFGNHNPPAKWHPFGRGNLALHDMRGVTHISVAQVLALVAQHDRALSCPVAQHS